MQEKQDILEEVYSRIDLSLETVTTTGSNLEQVISEPITGASREIARRTVMRCK